jgi:helicase MOV-10
VEAILQILKHNPNAHILACAPSNSAADLIALRLNILGPEQLFRFYAPSRPSASVPRELLPYCIFQIGHFSCPSVTVLKQYKVIVSTCISAAFAYGTGIKRGHFSHVFIDEAGQATEPEVMVPIRGVADDSTNVILSGDPRQLGPIIRSGFARELGLQTSYLERLMKIDLYDEKIGNNKTFVFASQDQSTEN